MYILKENRTARKLPTPSTGLDLLRFFPWQPGEDITFENEWHLAILSNDKGETLAIWEFSE